MVEPAELRIRNGSNASLRCNTNNGVPDTSIYWEKLNGRANCPNINTDSASETGIQSGSSLSLSGSGRQSGFGLSLSGSGRQSGFGLSLSGSGRQSGFGLSLSGSGSSSQTLSGSGGSGQTLSGSGSSGQTLGGSGGSGQTLSGSGGSGQTLSGTGGSGLTLGRDGELEQYQVVGNGSEFDFAPVVFGDEGCYRCVAMGVASNPITVTGRQHLYSATPNLIHLTYYIFTLLFLSVS